MPRYLTIVPGLLHAHYACVGTAGLTDIGNVGGEDFTELGTVALNADGPPPNPTASRGPCDGTSPGFSNTISIGGHLDLRSVADLTAFCWYRFDTLNGAGGQAVLEQWSSTAANRAFGWMYLADFDVMGVLINGSVTGVVQYGIDAPVAAGIWNFGGFSLRGGLFFAHHNGVTRGPEPCGSLAHTGLAAMRFGCTIVGGAATDGLQGDVAHLTIFKGYGFNAVDWNRFWIRKPQYPNGYAWEDAAIKVIAAQISKARGSVR